MREDLYHIHHELADENSVYGSSENRSLHFRYREALKMLYTEILTFQATWVCFFSKNGFKRVLKDSVKIGDWEDMFAKIKRRDENLKDMDKRWKEMTYLEKWEENNQLVRLNKAFADTQLEAKRKKLLNWLMEVDSSPWTNYNTAKGKRHAEISGWLVDKLEAFHKWKDSPNSLLWLHGKGLAHLSSQAQPIVPDFADAYI